MTNKIKLDIMNESDPADKKAIYTKKCIVCEKEFVAFHNKALYCSSSCSQKSYRERNYLNSWQKEARDALFETNLENNRLQNAYNQLTHAYQQKLREMKTMEESLKKKNELLEQQMTLLKELAKSRGTN